MGIKIEKANMFSGLNQSNHRKFKEMLGSEWSYFNPVMVAVGQQLSGSRTIKNEQGMEIINVSDSESDSELQTGNYLLI